MDTRITRFAGFARKLVWTAAMLALSLAAVPPAAHGAGISLIQDAETEATIRAYSAPLFAAAGLDPEAVTIYFVNDDRLNAFVAGGMNLFLNTGLLLAAKSPSQIIGVIAHETGHIAGGHLARSGDALRGATAASILSYVLGAAAIAAGSGEAAVAVIAGGQGVAQQNLLNYSRGQEQAADQFAITALERSGQSSRGMLEFLEIMAAEELLVTSSQNPYLRTHPLSIDRINFVRNQVEKSAFSDLDNSAEEWAMFRRMQAKLRGFLDPPARTFARYPDTDTSVPAHYARAVAHFRRGDLAAALAEIDPLIEAAPEDAFFMELKGQIQFESGRVADSVISYRRAVALNSEAGPILVGLAQALVETGDEALLGEAGDYLEAAVRNNRGSPRAWHLLSVVRGRTGRPGLSVLASAERALLVGDFGNAIEFAKRAVDMLPFGSPGHLRAQDLQAVAENRAKKKQRN